MRIIRKHGAYKLDNRTKISYLSGHYIFSYFKEDLPKYKHIFKLLGTYYGT